MLQPADLEMLLNLNFRRPYARGDVLVASGEPVDRFFLVEQGRLRLEPGGDVAPRFLGPGQVFGSTSVLQERPSEVTLLAEEDVVLLSLQGSDVEWLIDAEPSVAARLLRCLAAAVAARNVDVPPGAGAEPVRPVEPVSAPNLLADVTAACHAAREGLDALGPPPEDAPAAWARERIPSVSAVYRPVLKALASAIGQSSPADRARVIEHARRELYPLAGASRLVERMHTRPTGRAAGWRGFNHIYRNVPEGDDTCGLLTDAWLLTRPFAEALRERRTHATTRFSREILDRARPDRIYRILSLGCGPARSLADLLEEPGLADLMSVTCVDDDQEALVHANNLLKGRAPRADITFRQHQPSELLPDAAGFGGYDLVASLYTGDNSDAAALGRILFTAHRWMHAYGVLELVVFGESVPDWLLLEVLLDWKPYRHSARELQDVLARSPFNQSHAEVTPSPSGLNLYLRAVK